MATVTTTGSGNWSSTTADAPWPGGTIPVDTNAVTIATGHTVVLDGVYPVTGTYSTVTVTGTLEISKVATTGLNLGNASLTGAGTVRMKDGTGYLDKSYTCTFNIASTSDGSASFGSSSTLMQLYGDPAYYGSQMKATAHTTSDPYSGTALMVHGDVTAKWAANQWLAVHKGTTYSSYTTDIQLVQISSMGTYDGTATTINVGSSITVYDGATVLNLSRNIIVSLTGATLTSNNFNANRPDCYCTSASIFSDVDFRGINTLFDSNASGVTVTNIVARNGKAFLWSVAYAGIQSCIFCMSNYQIYLDAAKMDSSYVCGVRYITWAIQYSPLIIKNSELYAMDTIDLTNVGTIYNSWIYGCSNVRNINMVDCVIDKNPNGLASNSSNYFVSLSNGISYHKNVDYRVEPPQNAYNRSVVHFDYPDATAGNKIIHPWGTALRGTTGSGGYPAQRTSPANGSTEIVQIALQAGATKNKFMTAWTDNYYLVAGIYTIDIYVYNDFATNRNISPAVDISAFCYYPSSAVNASCSLETDARELTKDAWSNLQLGFTSLSDGWVKFWVEVYTYASGKYYYIDPLVVITKS